MPLTASQQGFLDYLKNAYPKGIRGQSDVDGSSINIYDKVRAIVLAFYSDNVKLGFSRLSVQTADATGILEWEQFLGLPIDTGKSLAIRRAAVIAKLVGSSPTIATIKSILQSIVQPHVTAVSIRELYLTSADPDDVFTYEVRLYAPIAGDYDTEDIKEILQDVHPAHCNVIMVIIPPLGDAMETTDSIDSVEQLPFEWALEGSGAGPDDGEWTEESPFFQEGYVWTDDGSYFPTVA